MAESSELERRDPHAVDVHARDPFEEPSVEWGWHGTFPRASRIGGWAIAAILLIMLIGNHRGHVEDLWLIGLAALVVIALVWDAVRRRTAWRR